MTGPMLLDSRGRRYVSKMIDEVGNTYGDLYVYGRTEARRNRQARFVCKCLGCGAVHVYATGSNLRRKKQSRCRWCSYHNPPRGSGASRRRKKHGAFRSKGKIV